MTVSLQGTLSGTDVRTQDEVEQLAQLEALEAAAVEAQAEEERAADAELARLQSEANAKAQAQSQASQALMQATQNPEQINPYALGIPMLLGNLASVIGQDPAYAERGRQASRDERAQFLQARKENLSALQENLKSQAEAALRAGDLLAEAQLRTKLASAQKAHDTLMQQESHIFEFKQNALNRQLERDLAKTRATNAVEPTLATINPEQRKMVEAWREKVRTNQVTMTAVPTADNMRSMVTQLMAENNDVIVPRETLATLKTLTAARSVVKRLRQLSQGIDPATGVKDPKMILHSAKGGPFGVKRFLRGAKLRVEAFEQNTPRGAAAARFQRTARAFLATLARSTGERGNLAREDVERAAKGTPGLNESQIAATGLFDDWDTFINDQEQQVIDLYTQPLGQTLTGPEILQQYESPESKAARAKLQPEVISRARVFARADNWAAFNELLRKHPELADLDDPEIEQLIQDAEGIPE